MQVRQSTSMSSLMIKNLQQPFCIHLLSVGYFRRPEHVECRDYPEMSSSLTISSHVIGSVDRAITYRRDPIRRDDPTELKVLHGPVR